MQEIKSRKEGVVERSGGSVRPQIRGAEVQALPLGFSETKGNSEEEYPGP